jgi:hypothetical protein
MEEIREDNKIRLFKCLDMTPHHTAGDLLYLPFSKSEFCVWVDEPCYKVDLRMIENSPKHYEEIFFNHKVGDEYHFISSDGRIISDYFLAQKHANLIRFGNGFKTIEEAEWASEQLRKFFQEKGQVLTNRDFLQIIQWIQETENTSNVIQKIRDRYVV